MNNEAIISTLEREWDLEHGFFGMLRQGKFDVTSLRRLNCALDAINLGDGPREWYGEEIAHS